MRLSASIPALAVALLSALVVTACGEGPTATVSGTVRTSTGAAIAGASVTSGSVTATTDADGRFELQRLPVGRVTLSTSAPRFDARSEDLSLVEGSNAHDVVLLDQTLFTHGEVRAYLPLGVAQYRAAIVFLPGLKDPATGNPLDSRDLVSGTWKGKCSIWCSPSVMEEVRQRSLALAGGQVALVGTTTLVEQPASYETLLTALSALGTQSLHPELESIPLLFVGHSMGGCTAYGFSRAHGARVAGFITMKGACHDLGPAQAAASVPGYFLVGGADEDYRRENITAVFEAGRAAGAPWAVSVDALGHDPMADLEQMFDWMDTVLTARLPESAGAPLRAVTETAGWLGDRETGAISTYACYGSTPSSASWLPSEETALHWQETAQGTGVVRSCSR
ncbi:MULTISPECIES: carboxypeptidase-like regulatory domain-containing protein [Myxococcaceae]|uniref:carboxypeptidase-like regulatory domain-containing protein n=1 Tax=Myxococcaceae TaxID=31 RepID=UPI00188F3C75|nr:MULTISPECIES: carboxypeptidase-like regulatory domain-containing protein [Myxococcaceae]MBF5043387.1 carboxypeptidase regulatory-like domain-containing protein [Simulacricoccus sp. 17bor-14]